MGQKTGIQWADSTVNLSAGCSGCELRNAHRKSCYAGAIHDRFVGSKAYPIGFDDGISLHPGRMEKAAKWSDLRGVKRPDKPWLDGMPRLIFVGDMSDIFSKDVPFDYLRKELIDVAFSRKGQRHVWMVLTKQPKRLGEFAAWLDGRGDTWPLNVWCGTSVTTRGTLGRVTDLIQAKVGVRFVSAEPLIEDIQLKCPRLMDIDLVIFGGESGPQARPCDLEWIRDGIARCESRSVAVFVKQLGSRPVLDGKPIKLRDSHGGDWSEWPEDLRVREIAFPSRV